MTSICGFGNSDFTIVDSMYNPVDCADCGRSVELADAKRGASSDQMYCDECYSEWAVYGTGSPAEAPRGEKDEKN